LNFALYEKGKRSLVLTLGGPAAAQLSRRT